MSTPDATVTGRAQAGALVPVQYGRGKSKGRPMPVKVAPPKGKLK